MRTHTVSVHPVLRGFFSVFLSVRCVVSWSGTCSQVTEELTKTVLFMCTGRLADAIGIHSYQYLIPSDASEKIPRVSGAQLRETENSGDDTYDTA